MIKGAKTIAEYKIKKWIQANMPNVTIDSIESSGDEYIITDLEGNHMTLVYDDFHNTVYEKE